MRGRRAEKATVSVDDVLLSPEKFLGKEVWVEGLLSYVGRSPTGEKYSINLPSEDNYDICVLRGASSVLMAYAEEELDLREYSGRWVLVRGYLKKLGDILAFKIKEIRPKTPER